MTTTETRNYRPSLVWPIILIGVGVMVLLDNLGVLNVNAWAYLFRLWPLILVAVGLDLMIGRRPGIWSAITAFIILIMFAAGIWVVQTTEMVFTGELRTEEYSQGLQGADSADVHINFTVGGLDLESFSNDELLVEGTLDLADGENLTPSFDLRDDVAYLDLETDLQEFSSPFSWWEDRQGPDDFRTWHLLLTDAVPIDLHISSGVGQSIIDLTGLILTDLDIDTGVGETIVILPGEGNFDASIDAGVGQLTIRIPDSVGVRIKVNTGLGNTNVSGFISQGNGVYISEGYNEAEFQITLTVSGGVGQVEIYQISAK